MACRSRLQPAIKAPGLHHSLFTSSATHSPLQTTGGRAFFWGAARRAWEVLVYTQALAAHYGPWAAARCGSGESEMCQSLEVSLFSKHTIGVSQLNRHRILCVYLLIFIYISLSLSFLCIFNYGLNYIIDIKTWLWFYLNNFFLGLCFLNFSKVIIVLIR